MRRCRVGTVNVSWTIKVTTVGTAVFCPLLTVFLKQLEWRVCYFHISFHFFCYFFYMCHWTCSELDGNSQQAIVSSWLISWMHVGKLLQVYFFHSFFSNNSMYIDIDTRAIKYVEYETDIRVSLQSSQL